MLRPNAIFLKFIEHLRKITVVVLPFLRSRGPVTCLLTIIVYFSNQSFFPAAHEAAFAPLFPLHPNPHRQIHFSSDVAAWNRQGSHENV